MFNFRSFIIHLFLFSSPSGYQLKKYNAFEKKIYILENDKLQKVFHLLYFLIIFFSF